MARIVFRIGYWNVYGAYNPKNRDGFGKVKAQAALMIGQGCDVIVTLENHEETYTRADGKKEKAYMPLLREMPDFEIIEGDGGNQLLVKKGFARLIRKRNLRMTPGKKDARSASKWNLESGGVRYWIGAAHFPAGQTAVRKAIRLLQVPAFLAFMASVQRGVIAYDSNDFHITPGSPQGLMDRAGWKSLKVKSLAPVVRGHVNSWHGHDGTSKEGNTWIEDLRTRKGVRVLASGLVPTDPKLSDHNFLWADLEIDSEVLLGKDDARA